MTTSQRNGFTLVEMVVVIAVILILVAITIPLAGYTQNRAARTRARGELAQMSAGLTSYQVDFGNFPRDAATDAIDPRIDVDPIGASGGPVYRAASLTLYSALSGDYLPAGMPDGKPEKKGYIDLPPNRIKFSNPGSSLQSVRFLQDPFGHCYGYSTAGLAQETQYQRDLRANPATPRPVSPRGYNPTFDLWSTSGQATLEGRNRWVKNWPDE